jgi:hypothetical protein
VRVPVFGPDLAAFAAAVSAGHGALHPDARLTPTTCPATGLRDPAFQRFIVAVWAVDQALYPDPVDQCDAEKIAWVAHSFPSGFRLWSAPDGLPVGYTAWHPIADATFRLLRDHPEALVDRGQIAPWAPGEAVYLFHYGLAAPLHRTPASRALLGALADDVAGRPHRAAVCVSEAGQRVAVRFGLRDRGPVPIGSERAWTT